MIEPQVVAGGASSWFCMDGNLLLVPLDAGPEGPALRVPAPAPAPAPLAPASAARSSVSCSGVVTVSGTLSPTAYFASCDRNLPAVPEGAGDPV